MLADETVSPDYPPVITRDQAIAQGLKRYFLGPDQPCKHGHIAERRTSSKGCVVCSRRSVTLYRKNDPEAAIARSRGYREADPEKARASTARYKERHPDRRRAAVAKYDAANRDKRRAYIERVREQHPEKMKEYSAQYRAQNPEKVKANIVKYLERHPEKVKAAQEKYRKANPEKVKAREEAYRKANPEKVKEATAKWRQANLDKSRTFCRNRHARKKAAEGRHTSEDIQRIYDIQKGRCACCGVKVGQTYDVDHVQPLSKGGSNWPSNLQILCPSCNRRKHNKDPLEFMQSLGFLL
jgi:5-methylcytosine-specific restriction endonuclease McrA